MAKVHAEKTTTDMIVNILMLMAPVARDRMESLQPNTRDLLMQEANRRLGAPQDKATALSAFNAACSVFPHTQANRTSALIVAFSDIVPTLSK